jgi:hypothetical protein
VNASAQLGDKIAKLIPRLASPHDGEVVATARAIERTLRGAGLDFHTLAKALCERVAPISITPASWRPAFNPAEDWAGIARWCRDHDGGFLSEKERAFIGDMLARVHFQSPTEKQAKWLLGIHSKLQRSTAGRWGFP